MKKNWLLKLNIVMVLMVVLFAGSVVYAYEETITFDPTITLQIVTSGGDDVYDFPSVKTVVLYADDNAKNEAYLSFYDEQGNALEEYIPIKTIDDTVRLDDEIIGDATYFIKDGKKMIPIYLIGSSLGQDITTTMENPILSSDMSEVEKNDDGIATMLRNHLYYLDMSANSSDTQAINMTTGEEVEHADKKTTIEKIEEAMSDFVLSMANVINWIQNIALGRTLTIDDIVFNSDNYPDARLDYFNTNIDGTENQTSSNLIKSLREPISRMYSLFRNLVLIGFMIILVYIGIKIMLGSTTADKKANYKTTFMAWVTGIIILFFMPYYMKYTIALNNAFVEEIGKNALSVEGPSLNQEANNGFIETDFEEVIDVEHGEDYMSVVGKIAKTHRKFRSFYCISGIILASIDFSRVLL